MKILKLMPDHCSTGLWDEEGINLCYNTIGHKYDIDYDLIGSIAQWQSWYDHADGFCKELGWTGTEDNYERFVSMGKILQEELQEHLSQFGIEVEYRV